MTALHVQTARTVPLSDLRLDHPLWTNPREFTGLGDKDITELGASIKINGIVDPLTVQRILINGSVVDLVIDGQRRYQAAREVLPKNAPIPVVDLTAEPIELTQDAADELLLKALATRDREDLSDYELCTVAMKMRERGKDGKYIGRAVGHSESWVSKTLKAFNAASPKLRLQWRKGEITTDQFKDLAEVKDKAEQEQKAKEVVEARKAGDLTEARTKAKEAKELARAKETKKPSKPERNSEIKPAVSGGQMNLLDKKEEKPEPPKPKPPSKVALEEMLDLAKRRPPTADYVKGLMDGVAYTQGVKDPSDFNKAWHQYLARIEGKASGKKRKPARKPAKKSKPSKPAKRAKKK